MKKFKFSLEALLKYKQTVEKNQKAELRAAQELLRQLLEQMQLLDLAFERNSQSLETALRQKFNVVEALERHDAYFRYLREARAELAEKIAAAEEEKERCQAQLILTMREIKTYGNLKEEQFRKYKSELAREEAKDMGDLVSFQTVTGEAEQ